MAAGYGRHFQMSKTFFQPLLQVDPLKQLLKNLQTGKGCKLIICNIIALNHNPRAAASFLLLLLSLFYATTG